MLLCEHLVSLDLQDKRWISQVLEQKGFDAQLEDLSSKFAIISVQGPYSRTLLQVIYTTYTTYTLVLPILQVGELCVCVDVGC